MLAGNVIYRKLSPLLGNHWNVLVMVVKGAVDSVNNAGRPRMKEFISEAGKAGRF